MAAVVATGATLERQYAHAERVRQPRDLSPDAAVADHPQRLAVQLLKAGQRLAHLVLTRPYVFHLPPLQSRQVMAPGQQHGEHVLGDGNAADTTQIRDGDAGVMTDW